MLVIETQNPNWKYVFLGIRLFTGFVWLATVMRRIFIPNFQQRISKMAEGGTLIPDPIMSLLVDNWFFLFLIVLSIEIIISISLLTGTLARGGAVLATFNGFAIGLAGIGLGIVDLLIPWSVAFLTLILAVFSHPGLFKGIDQRLVEKNLPGWLKILI